MLELIFQGFMEWAYNAVYLLYGSSVSDADIKADMKLASPTLALAYTAVKGGITQNADGKRYDQTFSFSTVPAGTYKLAIFKPGKYVPKIIAVNVDSSDVALDEVKLWLYGDVNYDGNVDSADVLQMNRYIAYKTSIFGKGDAQEQAERFEAGNITAIKNTDTIIDGSDVLQVNRYIASKSSMFDAVE